MTTLHSTDEAWASRTEQPYIGVSDAQLDIWTREDAAIEAEAKRKADEERAREKPRDDRTATAEELRAAWDRLDAVMALPADDPERLAYEARQVQMLRRVTTGMWSDLTMSDREWRDETRRMEGRE